MVVVLACSFVEGLNVFRKLMGVDFFLSPPMQEKGDLDLAIRYYLIAIEVSTFFFILFIPFKFHLQPFFFFINGRSPWCSFIDLFFHLIAASTEFL